MAQQLPTYEKSVVSDTSVNIGNYADSVRDYAAASNWMSSAGAAVATTASNAAAKELGTLSGTTPHGDLLPPITEFDKTYQESYTTQASSVLGLQANRLMTNAQMELAKYPRLTPELINSTQATVSKGLENIYKMAPSSIQPQMKFQYGSMVMNNTASLNDKMIAQQREDARDTLLASNQKSTENINSLGMGGHFDAAQSTIDSIKKANDAAYKMRLISKVEAQSSNETAEKTADIAKWTALGINADKNGVKEVFLRDLASQKPAGMSWDRWQSVVPAVFNNLNNIQAVKEQNGQLTLSNFRLNMMNDPSKLTGEDWNHLYGSVTAKQFTDMQIEYNKYYSEWSKNHIATQSLISGFSNDELFPQFTDKQKNESFNQLWKASQQKLAEKGIHISDAQAQMNTAMTAGGQIPVYTDIINSKFNTNNPQMIQEASEAYDQIISAGKGKVLNGVTDKSRAMMFAYQAASAVQDPNVRAQMAYDAIYNQTPEQQKATEEAYTNFVQNNKSKGQSEGQFALGLVDLPKDATVNVPLLAEFAKQKLHNYFSITKGSETLTKKMLQEDISNSFGLTYVNGKKELAYMPVEKVADLPDGSTGLIHNDLALQAQKQFEYSKKLYDQGKFDFYWEVKPRVSLTDAQNARIQIDKFHEEQSNHKITEGVFDVKNIRPEIRKYQRTLDEFNNSAPPQAIQHFRSGQTQTFDLVIQASPNLGKSNNANQPIVGGYDVLLKNDSGIMNIWRPDPATHSITYVPNREVIKSGYLSINNMNFHNKVLADIEKASKSNPVGGMGMIYGQ